MIYPSRRRAVRLHHVATSPRRHDDHEPVRRLALAVVQVRRVDPNLKASAQSTRRACERVLFLRHPPTWTPRAAAAAAQQGRVGGAALRCCCACARRDRRPQFLLNGAAARTPPPAGKRESTPTRALLSMPPFVTPHCPHAPLSQHHVTPIRARFSRASSQARPRPARFSRSARARAQRSLLGARGRNAARAARPTARSSRSNSRASNAKLSPCTRAARARRRRSRRSGARRASLPRRRQHPG